MSAPTTITIFYGTSSNVSVNIAKGSTYDQMVTNIRMNGGVWITSATGVSAFITWGQITSITAQ